MSDGAMAAPSPSALGSEGGDSATNDLSILVTAIEAAAEVIVVTDVAGCIVYANPAFERMTGYARKDVLGQKTSINKSGFHDESFYKSLWATISSGAPWHGRFRNRRQDGSLYDEEATIAPVRNQSGQITNFVAVKRDITRELELQRQLQQAQRLEAVGRLAGGIAHDFNNLLNAVNGLAGLLQSRADDRNAVIAASEQIGELSARAATLVRQLFAFSRNHHEQCERLDICSIVTGLLHHCGRDTCQDLSLTIDPRASGRSILGSREGVSQILTEIFKNAHDAVAVSGGVTIRVAIQEVRDNRFMTLPHVANGEYVLIECTDTGAGISPGNLEHIFDPYFTTKPLGKGSGLGLSMVYGIVTHMGGYITVSSLPPKGTHVSVLLPAIPK